MTQLDMFKTQKRIHANSVKALNEERVRLNVRSKLILRYVAQEGYKLTARDIMCGLGFVDPNQVRPRITELVGKGLLKEVDKVKDNITHKTVSTFMVTAEGLNHGL